MNNENEISDNEYLRIVNGFKPAFIKDLCTCILNSSHKLCMNLKAYL